MTEQPAVIPTFAQELYIAQNPGDLAEIAKQFWRQNGTIAGADRVTAEKIYRVHKQRVTREITPREADAQLRELVTS